MVDSCYVGALPPGFNQRAPAKTETLVLNAQTTSLSSGALTTAYAVVVVKSACAACVSSKLQNSAAGAIVGTNLALVVHVKLMHRAAAAGCPTVVPILRRFFIFATCKHHLARIRRRRVLLRGSFFRVCAVLVALLHTRTRVTTAAAHPEAEKCGLTRAEHQVTSVPDGLLAMEDGRAFTGVARLL